MENPLFSLDAPQLLAERTASVDRAVGSAVEPLAAAAGEAFALLAVGGYGRRRLFPHSDVDLLLLFSSEIAAEQRKDEIRAFLQKLWDCGMRVSHSVRTPAECLQVHDGNIELNVSILDERFLAGSRNLYRDLAERLPRFMHANRDALVRNLARLTRERHAKYAGTFCHLEPNVKETPGGLRDYQLLGWLRKLRGAEAEEPNPDLEQALRRLSAIRCWLHIDSGRDQNVLTFDAQDALAELAAQIKGRGRADTADWMRVYYRRARSVYRAATREMEALEGHSSGMFAQFRDWRARVANAEISVHRERAHFRQPQALATDPGLALRLFEFTARHGIPPSLEACRRIEADLETLRRYFDAPRALWPSLNSIFSLPHVALALRWMHETGLLSAIFPELKNIECLVVRDFYHRYTVDEHTLVAIGNLIGPPPPYSDLLAEVKDRGALVLAALFHDAGKASPEEGHVDGSLRLVRVAMERIAAPPKVRDDVVFLILRHLELSAAMQSRDLLDPQTIGEVARRIQIVERLKTLTLLTYSDISAVNPAAMTPWRSAQLWQLYTAVYNELTRELATDRIAGIPGGPAELTGFLEGFPTRYLSTHSDAEIGEHMALEEKSRKRGVAVNIAKTGVAWRMTIAGADRPGLFSAAAGTLSGFGMNILRAEAFVNRRGTVLDEFTFADPLRNLELNPSEVDRLRNTAERVLSGRLDVRTLLLSRPKPAPPSRKARIRPTVSFDSGVSETATLIEIVAEDRPGLVYDLSSILYAHDANIEIVLIDTEGHKAIDVFYVTAGGKKLTPETQAQLAEALGKAAL